MTETELEVSGRHAPETPVISILPRLAPHPEVEELRLHADALLAAERSAAVAAHVRTCAACAHSVQQLRQGLAMLAAAGTPPDDLLLRITARREGGERPLLVDAGEPAPADDLPEVAGRDRGSPDPDPPEPGPAR